MHVVTRSRDETDAPRSTPTPVRPAPAPSVGTCPAALAEERDLVRRVQAGDADAFAELYEAHAPAVRRFILRRVRDAAEADDLTHDTFVEAWRSIARFEARSRIRTWLMGIARHVCSRFIRFSSRWMTGFKAADVEPNPMIDTRVESRVEATRFLKRVGEIAVEGGRPQSARIFSRRYVEGSKMSTIAQDVGISTDAVKASLRRSRQRVTRELPELAQVLEGT